LEDEFPSFLKTETKNLIGEREKEETQKFLFYCNEEPGSRDMHAVKCWIRSKKRMKCCKSATMVKTNVSAN
jgi:hypothetical protein